MKMIDVQPQVRSVLPVVYDFQVEDNENFFVFDTEPQKAFLVHNCWLKPLEEPPATTTWLVGSMDPDKFSTSANGKAILNRCLQIHLSKPSEADLTALAKRIIKGEELTFFNKETLAKVIEASGGEMRALANVIQDTAAYYEGLADKPAKLTVEDISSVLQATTSQDEALAIKLLTCVYAMKFGPAHKCLLDVDDGFGLIMKMMNLNWFVLNNTILKGQRHPKVWASKGSLVLFEQFEKVVEGVEAPERVQMLGLIQTALTQLRGQAQAFAVPEPMAISQFLFNTIQQLKALR